MTFTGQFNQQQVLPDPIMSNIAITRMGTGEFIADQIAPIIGSDVDYVRFMKMGDEALIPAVNTKRAPGASAVKGSISRGFDVIQLTEDAFKIDLNEEDFQGQNPETVRIQAIDVCTTQIKLSIETRLASLVQAIPSTVVVPIKWSDNNPLIMKNWLDGREAFRHQFGVYPNTAIVPPSIWKIMQLDHDLLDYVKYTQEDLLANGLPQSLKKIKILVPTSNVKDADLSVALTDVWDNGEKCITYLYVYPGAQYDIANNQSNFSLKFTTGWAFQVRSRAYPGMTIAVRHWVAPDASAKKEWISCDLKQVEKVINPKLGLRMQVLP